MTVQCEHFIYGPFNGVGYQLVKSPGVDDLAGPDMMQTLKHLGRGIKQEIHTQILWSAANLVTVSFLAPRKDNYGRMAVWNHTIFVPVDSYLALCFPASLAPHFIRKLESVPIQLVPLTVG